MSTSFLTRSLDLAPYLIECRRHLHQYPELGSVLPKTCQYVRAQLEQMGYQVEEVASGGLLASVGQGNGKTLLIRADMDALPMQEESGEPFSSLHPGIAHTCGHDFHTAFLLGAAKLLKEREHEIPGTIKLFFQTAEETLEGAQSAIAAGVLHNPEVNAAMGIHVQPLLPFGHLNYPKGAFLSSVDMIQIHIRGKGCHAAMPHLGIDPINVAAHMILALQSLQVKEVPANEAVVLNICKVESGSATNIVPNEAYLWGTLRTYNDGVCRQIKQRMQEIVACTAQAFGAEAELDFLEHCPCTVNDPDLVDAVASSLQTFEQPFHSNPDYRLQVSDDFGFFSQEVPTIMLMIGCKPEQGQPYTNHSPGVRYDEAVLPYGAALLAHCAWDWQMKQK